MRTIAHISDLHFGRTDPAVLSDLKRTLQSLDPDVLVVSGDLTQRARSHEFEAAARFLESLPQPQVVVPGNHDVPLYNVAARWLWPLAKYRRHVGEIRRARYADDEVAVLGLNTARSFTFKNGRINKEQVARTCAWFDNAVDSAVRIVVTHHPFALPPTETRHAVIGRAKMALSAFADCKVDIVLSGHLHATQAVTSDTLYAGPHAALLVQAGTAASSRRRHEANAFNLLRISNEDVAIEHHGWSEGFSAISTEHFRRGPAGWLKV
jgi:3',5'-cyclic AMP phosphodiesterase CpdA